jgi:hypothetical protein
MRLERQRCVPYPQSVDTAPTLLVQRFGKLMGPDFLYRYHTGEYSHHSHRVFGICRLIGLQLHAAWVPTQSVCVVLNTESTRKNVTATLVTDVVLLLTMLVGLLRMRLHGNSMFGLAEILWRQVGNAAPFPL